MKAQGLGRNEMLKGQKEIDQLFQMGKRFTNDLILCKWIQREFEEEVPVRVVFSVPKKRFKKAVDRNLLKRRMREAYRKNKSQLFQNLSEHNIGLNLMFIYQSSELEPYRAIEDKLILLLNQLSQVHEADH